MGLIVFLQAKIQKIGQNYFWGKKPNFDIFELVKFTIQSNLCY